MGTNQRDPVLPQHRGTLSVALIGSLAGQCPLPDPAAAQETDPYEDDLQLALYVSYELHYRGSPG
ncbi:hypothetical protein ACFVT1_26535 [Streptomyces sp. NPDC057963]|uniref:hypothetical protein n=1 Tax=Streptomyces sp. NPDC057963 TaxID=3346290 RepID=UPI0036EC0D5B